MKNNKTPYPYKFGGRLTKNFPSQIIVDITEVCNLACVHCPHPEFKASKNYARRFLSPELNKKMVDEVRTEGGDCQYIRYTSNGEPLIHPKGYEMIQYAVDRSHTFVCLTTNGTIMKEKKTKQLLATGVHMIDISIDAFKKDTYAKIRVNGDLDVTRKNVQTLLKWVKETNSKTKVIVSFVEQPSNTTEIEEFKDFWENAGAYRAVIRRLHSAAGSVDSIKEQLENTTEKRYPCLYPWERLTLDPRGDLAFCPTDWGYNSAVNNFNDHTIKEVWGSSFMKQLREAHLKNDFSCHKFCGQCPDWQQTRWPQQVGSSYADLVQELKNETQPVENS
tara:strand:+ start:910 stop:1908 length:999 start_codon:yes stop_codon:yes gene_type:complete